MVLRYRQRAADQQADRLTHGRPRPGPNPPDPVRSDMATKTIPECVRRYAVTGELIEREPAMETKLRK